MEVFILDEFNIDLLNKIEEKINEVYQISV